ncbi:MAG: 2-amino-4-hydroxy-6-hydroxymethyldihydropteridine diphosphokinase [Nitrospiria bacterium]
MDEEDRGDLLPLEKKGVFVGIGSNMGNRLDYCRKAVRALQLADGIRIDRVSSLYETSPIGFLEQNLFYNAVVAIETLLSPKALLQRCQAIERAFGKQVSVPKGPRTIDLDLLFYHRRIFHSQALTLPHPEAAKRRFVLVPLAEIAPDFVHPTVHDTVRNLLKRFPPDRLECVEKRLPSGWQAERTGKGAHEGDL